MKRLEFNLGQFQALNQVFKQDDASSGVCVATASAFPKRVYTQAQIKKIFGIQNKVVNKLMDSGHIKTRHLYLPEVDPSTGVLKSETPMELHQKFLLGVREIGVKAVTKALQKAHIEISQVDQLIAVTSSGFAVPGVSSILARELDAKNSLHRLDVVGMGCNAGMTALKTAQQAVKSDKDAVVVLVCVEINSASYVRDETIRTGIVNSLFGDGASALVLMGENAYQKNKRSKLQSNSGGWEQPSFKILDHESFTMSDQWDAMRFDFNEDQNKWSFFLSKDIPFVIGENMKHPVERLLKRAGLVKENIAHWVMHTGGGAVIEGAKRSVGLTEEQVRHTRSVLRDYGNLSSGSFLVSLGRLYEEKKVKKNDLGMLIAMGPGATIEVALVRFI